MEVRDFDLPYPAVRPSDQGSIHISMRRGATVAGARVAPSATPTSDDDPEEHSLKIEVNGRPFATLQCSPKGLTELAVGYAFSEGLLGSLDQIQRITSYRDRVSLMLVPTGTRTSRSAESAKPIAPSDDSLGYCHPSCDDIGELQFDQDHLKAVVAKIFERFDQESTALGRHFAALCDASKAHVIGNDVRLQNVIDKLIGWALLQRVDCSRIAFCLSEKITSDSASRICRAGFPMAVSRPQSMSKTADLALPFN
jgi:FdhD protein